MRRRAYHLWARYPMVAVLGLWLLAVSGQEAYPTVWCQCLLLILSVVSLSLLVRSSRVGSALPMIIKHVVVAISFMLVFSLYHASFQTKRLHRLLEWQGLQKQFEEEERPIASPWRPIVCRCEIDAPVRYRRAVLARQGNAHGIEDWQSITSVRVFEVRQAGSWLARDFCMTLTIDGKISGFYPGDQFELFGRWRLPGKPTNPGQWDTARRYAELGWFAQAKADSVSQLHRTSHRNVWRIDRYLGMVSESTLRSIDKYVVLGQSELTAALVLGHREQAEWRLQEELLATGTIHMLSISGMHVEMVALFLLVFGMLLRFPRNLVLLLTCVIVVAYALLCGSNPPVARAAMMLSGLCLARWMGWNFSSLNFLAFVGLMLLVYRPWIAFETGAQLSFLAVAVLILSVQRNAKQLSSLQRLIESRAGFASKAMRTVHAWGISMLQTSFWVWFITAPLVWNSFHVISPIAILLNLVLWIPMWIALISGLGLLAFGWLPPAAWLLGWLCGISLWVTQCLVGMGEAVPLGHFWLRAPPAWWLYSFYGLGIGLAAMGGVQRARSRRRLVWVLGAWFALGLAIRPVGDWVEAWAGSENQKLSMTFIDVGHGTCVLIETPDRQSWLYDAGRMGDHQRSYQVMVETLWAMNRPALDAVLLSHADADHFNALDGISKRFSIRRLISTRQVYEHTGQLVRQTLDQLKRRGARPECWQQGSCYEGKGWSMLALHPTQAGVNGSDNANSLCVLIEFAGRRILLPGDLEPPGMQMLVHQSPTHVDLLMAPHHGSLSSKSQALLDWCTPETIVISGSTRALSPKVLESFEGNGREVFVTARDHAIRIEIDSRGALTKFQWKDGAWQLISNF